MNHIVRRLTGLLMCCLLLLSMLPAASLAAAPALTDLAADRQSDTTGLVSFTSDVGGKLPHEVLEAGGTASGNGPAAAACWRGANTLTLEGLTSRAKDIYIRPASTVKQQITL